MTKPQTRFTFLFVFAKNFCPSGSELGRTVVYALKAFKQIWKALGFKTYYGIVGVIL